MSLNARQQVIPGGHMIAADAEVADGQVHFELVWEHITADSLEVVGSRLTKITAWLNGGLVKDPARARKLWGEALRT